MSSDVATTATVAIKVLLFASAREAAGNVSQIDLQITMEQANTDDLRKILAELYPNLAATVLDRESVTLALNEEYIPPGHVFSLKAGDTVALIPPISGG
jgi:molybdopterin converting factor subunit 1